MTLQMISNNLTMIFAITILIGLGVVIGGVIMLTHRKPEGEPGTKVTVFNLTVENAAPGTLVLLTGIALVTAGGYFLSETVHPNQEATPAAVSAIATPSAASPSPVSAGIPFANITYPGHGAHVSRSRGFIMGGTVADPGPYTIWILDHPGNHFVVDTAATITERTWSVADRPLGNATSHIPYTLTVVAVLADPQCATSLNTAGASPATSVIRVIPSGCHQIDQRTVDITKP